MIAKEEVYEEAAEMLKKHVLYLTAVETSQMRYARQVAVDFMPVESEAKLRERISELLPRSAEVQVKCAIDFGDFTATGRCDVLHEDVVYELKFSEELSHEDFLQCACYLVGLNKTTGILWNTRDNMRYSISIPDVEIFKESVKRDVLGDFYNRR